jgi:hypothetical protein
MFHCMELDSIRLGRVDAMELGRTRGAQPEGSTELRDSGI